jgi:phospholipid/cholesterol/gamma-HCH transport system substrate-binding protein
MPRSERALKVGLLVLAAAVVLGLGIFLIGEKNNLFTFKNRYYILFGSVSGLRAGNPVQLNGVDVGAVQEVVLPEDPAKRFIRVWISVDRHYAERVREDTRARIKTLGLLGDKYVEISSGSEAFPQVPDGGRIQAAAATNVDALLASGEDVMANVVEISHSLSAILGRMERGEGLLGELTADSPAGRRMRESMVGTFESVERIADKIETGKGLLPRLINDPVLSDQFSSAVDRLESVVAKVESGPGLLPGLINDPQTKAEFDATLATARRVTQDLEEFSGKLQSQEGLLPRLVNDEAYGREISEDLRRFARSLNEVADKVNRGEGSAAKLINDPQIYDAVNDILVGVNQSPLLRWLIRSRQKKGIAKRYEDEQKKPQVEGKPAEAPPPAAEQSPEEKPPADTEPPAGNVSKPPALPQGVMLSEAKHLGVGKVRLPVSPHPDPSLRSG